VKKHKARTRSALGELRGVAAAARQQEREISKLSLAAGHLAIRLGPGWRAYQHSLYPPRFCARLELRGAARSAQYLRVTEEDGFWRAQLVQMHDELFDTVNCRSPEEALARLARELTGQLSLLADAAHTLAWNDGRIKR
jgi:predicted nucleic acid-binding Zn ribbon protein